MENIKSTLGGWEGQLRLPGGGDTCIDSSGKTGIEMEAEEEGEKGMALERAFPDGGRASRKAGGVRGSSPS